MTRPRRLRRASCSRSRQPASRRTRSPGTPPRARARRGAGPGSPRQAGARRSRSCSSRTSCATARSSSCSAPDGSTRPTGSSTRWTIPSCSATSWPSATCTAATARDFDELAGWLEPLRRTCRRRHRIYRLAHRPEAAAARAACRSRRGSLKRAGQELRRMLQRRLPAPHGRRPGAWRQGDYATAAGPLHARWPTTANWSSRGAGGAPPSGPRARSCAPSTAERRCRRCCASRRTAATSSTGCWRRRCSTSDQLRLASASEFRGEHARPAAALPRGPARHRAGPGRRERARRGRVRQLALQPGRQRPRRWPRSRPPSSCPRPRCASPSSRARRRRGATTAPCSRCRAGSRPAATGSTAAWSMPSSAPRAASTRGGQPQGCARADAGHARHRAPRRQGHRSSPTPARSRLLEPDQQHGGRPGLAAAAAAHRHRRQQPDPPASSPTMPARAG